MKTVVMAVITILVIWSMLRRAEVDAPDADSLEEAARNRAATGGSLLR